MCGRFVQFASWADLRRIMTLTSVAELPPNYNVAPTQQILVARDYEGRREGVAMRWGLIPSWAKDKKMAQINARADTAAEKPMFRSAFKKRRCLILADGYYEWKTSGKQKQPFFIRLKDEGPFTFAGLWETWHGDGEPLQTCTILTTDANDLTKAIHDRMPVILTGDEALAWIDPGVDDTDKLKGMLQPYSPDKMTYHAVDPLVGNVKNNSPDCIKPTAASLFFDECKEPESFGV
jgi:putative SOS response-associated peptidase YedK